LAAAVGTPTLALFGPTNPAIWCPAGAHVRWMPFAAPAEVAAVVKEMTGLL
jgi:ADP-heptose:LPS heptosyltransferase